MENNDQSENAQQQNVDIYGENFSGSFTQSGDINIQQYDPEPDFSELNLELFDSPDFVAPSEKFISQGKEILEKEHLLFLGGSDEIDKVTLARYLAWSLSKSNDDIESIKEWQHRSELQVIDTVLQEAKRSNIYVFNHILTQNIGSGLYRVYNAAVSKKHYVVVTTDTPQESWNFSHQESWIDLNSFSSNIYSLDSLVQELDKQLNSLIHELNKTGESLRQALQDYGLQKMAKKLQTPDKIARFVELIKTKGEAEKGTLNTPQIDEFIQIVNDNQRALNQWFSHVLDSREQLLVLGLCFFEGLFENQFFAALEKAFDDAWRKRDPNLLAFDDKDLNKLLNFFNKIPIKGTSDENRIESRFPEQRLMLFKIAMKNYSRQIIATLPTIEKLITDSVDNRVYHTELYGTKKTKERAQQFRKMLREALSDIVCISPKVVTNTLRHLAEDDNDGVQTVAAYALARWHDPECECDENELFETLKTWRDEAKKDDKTSKHILATIALTVGYAARYSPANEFAPELVNLFIELLDQEFEIRARFCKRILLVVLPLHIVQLRDTLRDLTGDHRDLIETISTCLAIVYRVRPEEVMETLDFWVKNQYDDARKRENLLATVMLTYGKIDCHENGPLTAKVFEYLQQFFIQERNLWVRRAILVAMGMKLYQNLGLLEPQLFNSIADIAQYKHERELIIEILTFIYQDSKEVVRSKIRKVMFRWAKDESKAIAALAKQALVNFALVLWDGTEKERLLNEVKDVSNFFVPEKEAQSYVLVFSEEDEIDADKLIDCIITWYKNDSPYTEQPIIVWQHLVPLPDLLCYMMNRNLEFISAMSQVVAKRWLYQRRSATEVLETLDFWKERPSLFQTEDLPPLCEHCLRATVALTYGKIEYDEKNDLLTASEAFEHLDNLFKGETNPLVRHAIIVAMGIKLFRNVEEIGKQLHKVIADITYYKDECELLIEILSQKPAVIEKAIYNWVTDDSNPIAQKFALQALVRFAFLPPEQDEREFFPPKSESLLTPPVINKSLPKSIKFDKLIPWIVTWNNKSYTSSIRNLLHEAWELKKTNKEAMDSVLRKWKESQDNRLIKLSDLLEKGFKWVKRLPRLIAAVFFVLLVAVAIIMLSYRAPNGEILPSRNGPPSSGLHEEAKPKIGPKTNIPEVGMHEEAKPKIGPKTNIPEVSLKVNELPNWVEVLENNHRRIFLNASGQTIQMDLHPKLWNEWLTANEKYPLWTATITGKKGPRIDNGFELLEVGIQIYERKP